MLIDDEFKKYIELREKIRYKLKNGVYTLQQLAEEHRLNKNTISDIIDSLKFEEVQTEDHVRFIELVEYYGGEERIEYVTLLRTGEIYEAIVKRNGNKGYWN